ncbi:aromatic-L-amino-acid decarboxylase-like [Patiria miniata]|uniref:Aromatic-L-amino-acid decarboxylase n=1 Tax=Patiria miniata TaxID=46514 RepID=A0A914BK67_PATMI|nr:aromatic-L-amino-acid decarboxylase-like [Patiria miniata]XP_038075842.1 aromatic-L-amino-acid decarboxylase-like [Patiria miniata]
MDGEAFSRRAAEMADFINRYLRDIKEYRVTPAVTPGYLHRLLPSEAPRRPESWESIMSDVEDTILPGMTHWQHPGFHAYFPAGNSYASILADMLSDGLGCIGFSWAASPAMTELETLMVDWLGRMMGLPKEMLPYTEGGNGGGVIQGSASECTLVCMLAARAKALNELKEIYPDEEDCVLLSKLVAYFSEEAHSSVEKAANIAFVKRRKLPTDAHYSCRGETLRKAVETDVEKGLVPFFVCATIGTTGVCACDDVEGLGRVCSERNLWLHVDGAYSGNALICPEFRYLLRGFQYVKSFNFNPNKWMMVNFDCSVMWVRDKHALTNALTVNPIYLQHDNEAHSIDYRNWTIPLSRRFRSLKLWFVIRMYGVEGLQQYIRSHVAMAKRFEALVRRDARFEILGDVVFGLVCFRLKGPNNLTESLLRRINQSGKAHMVPASLRGTFVIRFAVCHPDPTEEHVQQTWGVITSNAECVLFEREVVVEKLRRLFSKYKENRSRRPIRILGELKKNCIEPLGPHPKTCRR